MRKVIAAILGAITIIGISVLVFAAEINTYFNDSKAVGNFFFQEMYLKFVVIMGKIIFYL